MQDMKNEFDSKIQQFKREMNESTSKTSAQITKVEAPVHVVEQKKDFAHQMKTPIHVEKEK